MNSIGALSFGMHAMLGLSLAILLILIVRAMVMRWFGPQITYALWLVLPAWMLATLLPAPALVVAQPQLVASARAQISLFVPATTIAPHLPWAAVIVDAWVLGAIAILAMSLRDWARIRGASRHAKPLASFEGIAVLSSAHWPYGPAIVGIWRPVIVVPANFEHRYAADERRLILAHEATHARRFDALANGIATLGIAFAWFNPLAWLALIRFRRDQELSCDAAVLSRFKLHKTYGEALLKTHYALLGPLAGCNWLGLSSLKERVMMIKQPHRSRNRRVGGWLTVAIVAAASGYTAHVFSADTPSRGGSILVQVDTLRADGTRQSSLVCVAPDQPIAIPYDRGPGDLGNLYFHVAHISGDEFTGKTLANDPPLLWHVYGFAPSFHRVTADALEGDKGSVPDIYARTGGNVSVFYGNPENLQVDIKVTPDC